MGSRTLIEAIKRGDIAETRVASKNLSPQLRTLPARALMVGHRFISPRLVAIGGFVTFSFSTGLTRRRR